MESGLLIYIKLILLGVAPYENCISHVGLSVGVPPRTLTENTTWISQK
jgi:hypothetical protein